MGIIDDYFDGYYSEEMIESQVMIAVDPLSLYIYAFLSDETIFRLVNNYGWGILTNCSILLG